MHLTLIDQYGQALGELDTRIAEAVEPFQAARDLLTSIPGFSTTVAEVVLAETGGDMRVFPTAGHLASWAGTAPGSHESAGRVKSTKTRPGNRHLEGALGTAALSVSRSKGTFFSAKYKRIASRQGPMKALVAVQHAMLVAAWNMLTNGDLYRDPGPDYYTRRVPTKTRARAIGQLESLGYRVILEPAAGTA
jgi:transposase